MILYDKIPDMECLSGDTLPEFMIYVESDSGLEGGGMQMILAKSNAPNICILSKVCEPVEGGFSVQIDSDDTSNLTEGAYEMHFCLTAPGGKMYRKLSGSIYIHSVAQEA